MVQRNEARQVPMSKELCELREAIEQAHLLYSDLNSRISCVINNVTEISEPNIKECAALEEESSPLVKEIKTLKRTVNELCQRIRKDLNNIEI